MGLDILAHKINYKNNIYALQIWDFGGQDCFKQIRQKFYKESDGIVLIFSLTDISSLERLEHWIEETRPQLERRIPLVIAANKTDLIDKRLVEYRAIVNFLDQNDLTTSIIYTSAKTGENINRLFYKLVEQIVEKN
ncbi:MAG: Rab family GTPase, partial [Candidatus Hodarchaeales archaeon]|jgi:small GTP-binding protein